MRIWKKVLSVVLVVVMLAVSVPVIGIDELFSIRAASETVYVQGIWHYKIVDDYSVVVGITPQYNGNANTIIAMPDKLGGYPVKVIQSVNLLEAGIQCKCKFVVAHGVETISAWAFNSSNMSSIVIPCTVKSIGQSAFANCKFTALYYGGTEEQYNDISFGFGALYYPINFYGAKIYYNHNEHYEAYHANSSDDEKTNIFPEWYNKDIDKYSFPNLEETISADIYKNAFGTVKGTWLHWLEEDGNIHGHCYGMSSTTAALLKYPNAVSEFKSIYTENYYCTCMDDLFPEYVSDLFGVDLRKYIKYGHIYQFDNDVQNSENISQNDLNGLYNAVKEYVDGNGDPVIVNIYHKNFWGRKHGHSVFAAGLTEEKGQYCILINDSNIPYELQKMFVSKDFSTWSYWVDGFTLSDGTAYQYGSDNGEITYSCPADVIYQVGLLLNENKSEFLSTSNNLIYSTGDIATESSLTEILPGTETTGDDNQETDKLYWMEDDVKEISLEALEDDTEITISDINSSVKVELDEADKAEFYVDDASNSYVYFDTDVSDSVDIEFSNANKNGEITDITITATAAATEITATQTDTGLVVTGIEDGIITLTQDDEVVATKRVTNAKGDVEITYDAEGETTDLSATYEHEHTDYDHNGKCDICLEVLEAVKNCTCICHKSGFMALVYAFVNLFWRIFGMYKTCECGVWHW